MARRVLQQRQAVGDRVLPAGVRELVDERLAEEGVVRMADRAPEADRHAAPRRDVGDALVGDRRRAGRTGPRSRSCRACRPGRRAPAWSRSIQRGVIASPALVMRSVCGQPSSSSAGAQHRDRRPGDRSRASRSSSRDQTSCTGRPPVSSGDAHRLADEVDVEAAAEAAAEIGDVDRDRVLGDAGDLGGERARQPRHLRRRPDLDLAVGDARGAVDRLHRRVREVGRAIDLLAMAHAGLVGRADVAATVKGEAAVDGGSARAPSLRGRP